MINKLMGNPVFAARAAAAMAGVLAAAGCTQAPERYQGYVEGQFTYVSAAASGPLDELVVTRGARVVADQPLFVVASPEREYGARRQYQEWQAALERSKDLDTGKRAAELDVIESRLQQAAAAATRSSQQRERAEADYRVEAVSLDRLEAARSTAEVDTARVRELRAELASARLPAREAQSRSQRAQVQALAADHERSRRQVEQLTGRSPGDGIVVDTFHRRGEWLQAGGPVVKLLLDRSVKLRFFVPETRLSALRIGAVVKVSCDGCAATHAVRIGFIATEAEYTPPVIFSSNARSKLVFMVEAEPGGADEELLRPGLPIEVLP